MDYLAISITDATLKFLKDGGMFIYPLLVCSVAGLTAIGFKFLALSRKRVIPDQLVYALQNASDPKNWRVKSPATQARCRVWPMSRSITRARIPL